MFSSKKPCSCVTQNRPRLTHHTELFQPKHMIKLDSMVVLIAGNNAPFRNTCLALMQMKTFQTIRTHIRAETLAKMDVSNKCFRRKNLVPVSPISNVGRHRFRWCFSFGVSESPTPLQNQRHPEAHRARCCFRRALILLGGKGAPCPPRRTSFGCTRLGTVLVPAAKIPFWYPRQKYRFGTRRGAPVFASGRGSGAIPG